MILRVLLLALFTLCVFPGCTVRKPGSTVYVVCSATTQEERSVCQDTLYMLSKNLSRETTLVIDTMKLDDLENLYSERAFRGSIREVSESLEISPSSDQALAKALDRASLLGKQNEEQKVYAIILTSGTTDDTSLELLKNVCKTVPVNTYVYAIGIDESKRLKMSTAFTDIKDRVKFASSDYEVTEIVRGLQ